MMLHSDKPAFHLLKKFVSLFLLILVMVRCKLPFSETDTRDTEKNTLFLKFNPKPGSHYRYTMESETNLSLEMEGKKTEKQSAFNVVTNYRIDRDTSNNYIYKINYDKVHLETKNNDVETVSDAENASFSPNGIDRMLGALKEANLVVSVSPAKEVRIVSGYEELSQKLLSMLNANDTHTREVAQQKIDEVVKKGLIQRNVDQLFRFFPDSAMRIGSKWKMDSKVQEDFNLNVSTFYSLDEIEDGIAFINSKSKIKSDETPLAIMGYSVVPDLSGEGDGTYQVEASTCMLLNASLTSIVKGSLKMGTSSIPVSIKVKVNISGKRT